MSGPILPKEKVGAAKAGVNAGNLVQGGAHHKKLVNWAKATKETIQTLRSVQKKRDLL